MCRPSQTPLRKVVQQATEWVNVMGDFQKSGEAAAWIDVLRTKIDPLVLGFGELKTVTVELLDVLRDKSGFDGALSEFLQAMWNLPENVRAVAQGVGAAFAAIVGYAEAAGRAIYHGLTAGLTLALDQFRTFKDNVGLLLNPSTFLAGLSGVYTMATNNQQKFSDVSSKVWQDMKVEMGAVTDAFTEQIVMIMNDRDVSIGATEAKIKKIQELRDAYKQAQEAAGTKPAPAAGVPAGKGSAEGPGTGQYDTIGFRMLKQSLRDEEDAIRESYEERRDLIVANTIGNADERSKLMAQLDERMLVEMDNARAQKADRLQAEYDAEQNMLQGALDRREITEEQFLERSKKNWQDYTNKLGGIAGIGARMVYTQQLSMYSTVLSMAGDITTQLSNLMEENSNAAKAMFVASKAVAIAQAIVNTELAATAALAQGGMIAGIPMSTAIRALGYTSVALMAATGVAEYRQKFEHGGMIPSGKYGITQEAGFELVKGPAVVTSARTTADLLSDRKASGSSAPRVVINNYAGANIETQERQDSEGSFLEVVINRTESAIAGRVRTGGTPISSAFEKTYALRRGGA